jgi:hypothetical protein
MKTAAAGLAAAQLISVFHQIVVRAQGLTQAEKDQVRFR